MAHFEYVTHLAAPPEVIFDFLCNPANLIEVTPAEYRARLVSGPDRLHLGARVVLEMRRFGVKQRIESEIVALELNKLLADEQRSGPFARWRHTHVLEPEVDGTKMTDTVDYEPPGGMLGQLLAGPLIEKELREMFAYRAGRFAELLPGSGQ